MYLVALVYLFTGPGAYGLRLTSALIGTATIPAAYLAFREMFGRRLALLGAILTATAYWHFNVTRTGFSWTLMPLAESVAIYLLWRGYRDGKPVLLALGGVAVGSTVYIYLAARFFPIAMILILVYLLCVDRARFRARWWGILLAVIAAVLIFVPLGVHFLRNPQDFWERANQVGVWAQAGGRSALSIIADNARQVGITYLPHWDMNTQYSLHGRPIFDVLIGPFFLLGVALALWKWRQPEYGVLLVWWIVMSLPPVFSANPMPVGQRMFGAIPTIYGLASVGMDGILRWANRRAAGKAAVLALAVVLAAEAVWGGVYYFRVWGTAPGTYYGFHSDYVEIGRLLGPEMEAGHRVIIASEEYRHPSIVFTEPQVVDAKWVVGSRAVALPAWDGREQDYFVPVNNTNLIPEALQVLEKEACSEEEFAGPAGTVSVTLYRICRPPALETPPVPVAAFADEAVVWSVDVPQTARRDQPLQVSIQWEVLRSVNGSRAFAAHLVDSQGVRWAQTDEMAYISAEWEAGDRVWQWLEIPVDPSLPPGTYQVRLILSGENAAPLPVQDAQGAMEGYYINAGEVRLTEAPPWVEPAKTQAPIVGPVRIWDWSPLDVERRPGEEITAEVWWQAAQQATGPLSVVLEMQGSDGQVAARWEYTLATEYPAARWEPDEVVRQRYLLRLPNDIASGQYTLRVGLSGQGERVSIGTVSVAGVPRIMTPPPMQHPLAVPVNLGGKAELLGYDLDKRVWEADEPIRLTLYWRALESVDTDYRVFVHLLDAGGEIVSQRDVAPADGLRPTTGWLEGEFVADVHVFPPQEPGEYHIAVGMYDPLTMTRLEMHTPSGERIPDDRLFLDDIRVE